VATPEELDAPVITIEATDRPRQWVELVGERYAVRRPKDLVESGPKTAIMKVAAFFAQDTDEGLSRAERRAKSGKPAARIELAAEDIQGGTEAVWQYLEVALDDPADYAAIRRRVYGPDISDEDATAHTYIECASDPNPGDDIDVTNIVALVTNLMTFWSPEAAETVKSNVRPPGAPKPAAKKAVGSTVKRPARRPAKRG
jgi:hypothetical protein